MQRSSDYIRPRGYYDNQGNLLKVSFETVNNALSGITVSARQLNYATSFPGSAAYSVSAGYAVSAGTAARATTSDNAAYAVSAGALSGLTVQTSAINNVLSGIVTSVNASTLNLLSGLTVSAAQLNYATSFPASAAYAQSAGTAAAAVTSINSVSSLYSVSANYAVSASTAAQSTTSVAAVTALKSVSATYSDYSVSAGALSGLVAVSAINNAISGLVTAIDANTLNLLSGLTASAAQLNYSTSFPASAAHAQSAGTAAAATTSINSVSSLYSVSAGYAASAGSLGLTTSMWKDLIMPGISLGVGASVPDLVTLTGNILARGFDGGATTEQLYGTFEMQHDYKEGTDIRPHIHWCPADTSTGEVIWNMEYSIIPISGVAGTATTLTATSTANGTQNSHTKKEFGIVSGSMQVGTIVAFRVYRDPTVDTYTGDSILLDMGLHYEVSSLGSINIYGN